MPLYDVRCVKCGVVVEVVLRRWDTPDPRCTRCGAATERLVGLPAFHDIHQTLGGTIHRPYVTNNIHSEGKPIEITSHAQLERECKKHGVTPAFGKESKIG